MGFNIGDKVRINVDIDKYAKIYHDTPEHISKMPWAKYNGLTTYITDIEYSFYPDKTIYRLKIDNGTHDWFCDDLELAKEKSKLSQFIQKSLEEERNDINERDP